MHTKDWFDPTKAGKKAKEKSGKAAKAALEVVGLGKNTPTPHHISIYRDASDRLLVVSAEEEQVPDAVGCALEANGRLWMGCSTGHLCAVDVASARLESAIDVSLSDVGNGITALTFTDAGDSLVIWAGKSGGDIAVLRFDSMANIRMPSHVQAIEQPDQLSTSSAVVGLLPSPDGARVWAVYDKVGLCLWDALGSHFGRSNAEQWIEAEDSTTEVAATVIVGDELWIGYTDSTIHIYDANSGDKVTVLMPYESHAITSITTDGEQVWVAHVNSETRILDRATRQAINIVANDQRTPVTLLSAPTRISQMWTTSEDGTLRVWPTARTATPAPPTEAEKLKLRRPEYTKPGRVRVRAMSWNVGDVKDAGVADMGTLLAASQQNDLIVVGLQGEGIQSHSMATMWEDAILGALQGFKLVQAARHTGLLLFVAVVEKHEPYVLDVTTQTAAAELLKQETGKAIAVHFTLHETEFSFVNSVLTSGQSQVAIRNAEVNLLTNALLPIDPERRVLWLGDMQYRVDQSLDRIMQSTKVLGDPEDPNVLTLVDRVKGGTVEFDFEVDAPLSLSDRVRGGDDDEPEPEPVVEPEPRSFVAAELPSMKAGALRKLCLKEGVAKDLVDEVMEAPKPKDVMIELLKALLAPPPVEVTGRFASLDLNSMKMSELTELCEAEDIDEDVVDDAMDEDDPKQAVIKLLLALDAKRSADPSVPGSVAAAASVWEVGDEPEPELEHHSASANPVLAAAMQAKARAASPTDGAEVAEATGGAEAPADVDLGARVDGPV